jgi:hypothetical protein
MKGAFGCCCVLLAAGAILAVLLLTLPSRLDAQNMCTSAPGANAVYGNCNNGNIAITSSSAFIDASQFAGNVQSPNFCSVVGYVLLNRVPSGGAVIDARGLPGITNTGSGATSNRGAFSAKLRHAEAHSNFTACKGWRGPDGRAGLVPAGPDLVCGQLRHG